MPAPRFTIVQLFLAATLVALLLGLFTAADRLGPGNEIRQLLFSPNGNLVAARYQTGMVRVWRLDGEQARLVAQEFGVRRLPPKHNEWLMESMYFADDGWLIKIESHQMSRRVALRRLDLSTGKVTDIGELPIRFAQQWNSAVAADRVYVSDWGTGN